MYLQALRELSVDRRVSKLCQKSNNKEQKICVGVELIDVKINPKNERKWILDLIKLDPVIHRNEAQLDSISK